ncbi:hypothetical protein SeLEV6574_g07973 [Synchytrium endobioticum]|uniref:Reverse transcriptase domain-containing protein n=1 Tax=Synchytrium endobioticum TaxID=286115 RepID=A0A507CBL5_9FUNG|nr:hypothetical protein SeLEV6574_g07973 [Synchytrium endobioticum]
MVTKDPKNQHKVQKPNIFPPSTSMGIKYFQLFINEEIDPEILEEILESTLRNTGILQISMTHQMMLEEPINETDINHALKQLKNGKAAGPDGITTEFYKKFPDIVKTFLLSIFNRILRLQGKWEKENMTSIIVLIEKRGDLTSQKLSTNIFAEL